MADTATPKARKAPAKRRVKAPPPPSVWKNVGGMAAAIFLLDQALKYVVVHVLQLDRVREIDVLDPWLNLRMVADTVVIGRDDHARDARNLLRGFPAATDQRQSLAGCATQFDQRLAGIAGRGMTRRNDDDDRHGISP